MQELDTNHAGHSGGQINLERAAQIHILGGNPHQYGQKKPLVVAIEGRKGGIEHGGGSNSRLPAALPAGQKHALEHKKCGAAQREHNAAQMTEPGQSALNAGTEHLRKHQQKHHGETENPVAQFGLAGRKLAQRAADGGVHRRDLLSVNRRNRKVQCRNLRRSLL